jgi:NADH dehydrogenase
MLPTIEVEEADINDPAVLDRLTRRTGTVINLVGILNEAGAATFEQAHVELARKIVGACKVAGITRLVQMSALRADRNGPSRYLRSKGEAEEIVASSGLRWTIFRPSVVFGREDSLLNLFAKLQALLPLIPLGAAAAKFQPVYVGDVARAFVHSLRDEATVGQRYDLCGAKVYSLAELVRYVGELTGHSRPIVPLGGALANLQAGVLEHLPGRLMSRDNLASMQVDNVCAGPFPAVFGFTPTPLEAIAPTYIGAAAVKSPFDEYRARSGR